MPHSIDDTCIGLSDCILEPKHIWTKAKDITVHPSFDDVGGVSGFYRPPLAAPSMSVKMLVNGRSVEVADYCWSVDSISRVGYLDTLAVTSNLVPVAEYGYIERILLTNKSAVSQNLELEFSFSGGFEHLPSGKWGWVPPSTNKEALFESSSSGISASGSDQSIYYSFDFDAVYGDGCASIKLPIMAGSDVVFHLSCRHSDPRTSDSLSSIFEKAVRNNRDTYSATIDPFPALTSSNKDLEKFYNRGLVTFHTCIWESDSFTFTPFMAESGIDGGAVCNYPWGIAYICKLLSISHPSWLKQHIVQILKTDLRHHYAYTPLDGTPVGPWYSYNQYSIIACAYHYVNNTGDISFLRQVVNDKTVYDHLIDNACFGDDLSIPVRLIDYGTNENLLEMKKTSEYEHYVPSPNAERCWSYRAVAELGKRLGEPNDQLTKRANELSELINKELWDSDISWLVSKDLDGNSHSGWSIQVFDTLRTGVLNHEQAAALAEHLNEREFLSQYGVHSLSKLDPGYDCSDVDWGGPGVYSGDGPELMEDLYLSGLYEKGDEVLKRIIWWGCRLPYYPQAMIADAIDYRRDGRANIVAGLKINESLVFGLLGLVINDRSLSIKPHLPAFVGNYCIDNIRALGKDIRVDVCNEGYRVEINGKEDLQLYPLGHRLEICS